MHLEAGASRITRALTEEQDILLILFSVMIKGHCRQLSTCFSIWIHFQLLNFQLMKPTIASDKHDLPIKFNYQVLLSKVDPIYNVEYKVCKITHTSLSKRFEAAVDLKTRIQQNPMTSNKSFRPLNMTSKSIFGVCIFHLLERKIVGYSEFKVASSHSECI